MEYGRILVIQLRQMGDVLLCTPALRALRKKFAGAKLAFLTDKSFEPLLRLNPDLNEVIARDSAEAFEAISTVMKARRFRPDLAVDFFQNPRSTMVTLLSGAKTTLSYGNKRRSFFYSIKADPSGEYVAAEKLSLLKPLGIESGDLELTFNFPKESAERVEKLLSGFGTGEKDFLVTLDLFHKRPARQWPIENFIEIADRLTENFSAKVVVTCLSENRARAEQAVSRARRKHAIASSLDLFELAALIKRSKLFLGGDGGAKHIAVSQKTRSFTILGPSGMQWTPASPLHRTASLELDCRPCEEHVCPKPEHSCQSKLSADMVWEQLGNFVASFK
jgi:ADP-heptose:LPS heptosyltransferase